MVETQAERLIERIKDACSFNKFDEPGIYAAYLRTFVKYDYGKMEKAIDAAIEDDSKHVPPISAFMKKYKEIINSPKDMANISNDEYCAVCDDKGFVMMKEKHPEATYNGEPVVYEYVLYCPFCAVGRAQAYDGRNISDTKHRSPYRVPPLTEYFGDEGIAAMREENLKRRAKKTERTRPVKKELQAVGKSVPGGWQYDVTDDLPF